MQIVPASANADHQALPQVARDAMRRLELALTTPDPAIVEKVRVALGFRAGWQPRKHLGETETHVIVWSQVELNDVFERVGGSVTARQVERSTSGSDTPWVATELILTVDVPGVGPVQISTDLETESAVYPTDLPVVALARYQAATTHLRELAEAGDYDGCLPVQDEMTMCRRQLAAAGRLDLIEAA
jgi:hypothetical protein